MIVCLYVPICAYVCVFECVSNVHLICNECERDTMEKSCITDTFYCHFPSCTEQSARKREKLAESRRQDYQNYLKQMSLNDIVANRRHTNYSNNHKVQLNGKFVTNRGYDYNDDIIDANENQTPPRTILTKAIIEAIPATSDAGGKLILLFSLCMISRLSSISFAFGHTILQICYRPYIYIQIFCLERTYSVKILRSFLC